MSIKSLWQSLTLSTRIILGLICLLLVFELFFDIFEIAIGQVMLWTNDRRPKIGRLWTEEARDLDGQQQASSRIDSLRLQPAYERYIHSFDDLVAYVAFKSGFMLSRDEFLSLYRLLPGEDAGRLMDPMALGKLANSPDWSSVKMAQNGDKLQLLFLDPFGQPLLDSGVLLLSEAELMQASHLHENPLYTERTIPAPLFVSALESLPPNLRLQVINDPLKWNEWRQKLISAAIAPTVQHGSVKVALEVTEEGKATVHEIEASLLAAEYLIRAINQLNPDNLYEMPVAEENDEQ
jgi:hypothetical protein